jgi:hypothetical protein
LKRALEKRDEIPLIESAYPHTALDLWDVDAVHLLADALHVSRDAFSTLDFKAPARRNAVWGAGNKWQFCVDVNPNPLDLSARLPFVETSCFVFPFLAMREPR